MRVRRSAQGMTLAEVIVALGLLSVGALGVIGMFPTMAQSNRNSMESTAMLYAAQSYLDELLNNDTKISTNQTTPGTGDPVWVSPISGGSLWFKGISDTQNPSNVQTIQVHVQWVNRGRVRSIDLFGQVAP